MFARVATAAAVLALVAPTASFATVFPSNLEDAWKTGKQILHNNYKTKHKPNKPVKHTATQIVTAAQIISAIQAVGVRDGERAGYCSPVAVPRVNDSPGVFLNLYAAPEARSAYLAAGLTEAKKDPVTGSISC